MPSETSSSSRLRSLRNWAVALPALTMLMAADGDCALLWATLESPVQGVTVLLSHPDGDVTAELLLVTTENWREHEWVDSAEEVQLRIPDGTIVELIPQGNGSYKASSNDEPALIYMGEERYRLTFELDDEAAGKMAGEEFIAVIDAPTAEHTFTLDRAPEFAGDTADVSWTPSSIDAMIEVRDAGGELIYTTFDLSEPQFDGDKWASIARYGDHTFPVDVFSEAGTYTIKACTIATQEGFDDELSGALGVGSGFLAGVCHEPIEIVVGE